MGLFSLGNLFGSLGFHNDAPAPAAAPVVDPVVTALTTNLTSATQALTDQTKAATDASNAALAAQQKADADAAAASVPVIDSESARQAGEDRQRKLQAGNVSFGIGLPSQLGAAPVGFRALSGN